MKRIISLVLTLTLLVGAVPAARADEAAGAWEEVAARCEAQGLSVTWYPGYDAITRLYGSERMLLFREGKCALFGLDGYRYTDPVFDTVQSFDAGGAAPARRDGKWGIIDDKGNTLTGFLYETAEEAVDPPLAKPVQEPGGWKYAIAAADGTLLTEYKYWATGERFSQGMLSVFLDADEAGSPLGWGYVNDRGEEAIPCRYYRGGVPDYGEDGLLLLDGNLYDKAGAARFPQGKDNLWRAGCGLYGFTQDQLVGFCDAWGSTVIQPQYLYYQDPKGYMEGNVFFEENRRAQVYLPKGDGSVYSVAIDADGTVVGTGEEAIPDSRYVWAFHEGLVWENPEGDRAGGMWPGPWGFRDEAGNLAVDYLFEHVGYFDHGYASVKVGPVYGMLKNPLERDAVSPWAAEELAAAEAQGLIIPRCAHYQTYTVTRAQFASLMVNYLEKAAGQTLAPTGSGVFADTADDAVLRAYAAGVVQGMGDGTFAPDAPLTREQLAAMLWRALERVGVVGVKADLTVYADGAQVAPWALDALSNLVGLGVIEGTGNGELSPQVPCTVEQAVLLLARAARL